MKCWLALTALAVASAMLVAKDHVRLNLSPSMPIGLWWITSASELRTGDVVMACLPGDAGADAKRKGYIGAGECEGDRAPLLKPIMAVPGDVVVVTMDGIAINGDFVPGSAVMKGDTRERRMDILTIGKHLVAPNTFWLLATRDSRSFDSRYFGPLHVSTVRGIAHPLLTWDN